MYHSFTFFYFNLFWRVIILALTLYFSFFISYILAYFSFCFRSSTKNWLFVYSVALLQSAIISFALFILWTPFKSYCWHEVKVSAEFSKLEKNYGNFFVFKYNAILLSKFFFYNVVYSLLNSVAFSTSAYKTFNFSVSYYLSLKFYWSFSSAFSL